MANRNSGGLRSSVWRRVFSLPRRAYCQLIGRREPAFPPENNWTEQRADIGPLSPLFARLFHDTATRDIYDHTGRLSSPDLGMFNVSNHRYDNGTGCACQHGCKISQARYHVHRTGDPVRSEVGKRPHRPSACVYTGTVEADPVASLFLATMNLASSSTRSAGRTNRTESDGMTATTSAHDANHTVLPLFAPRANDCLTRSDLGFWESYLLNDSDNMNLQSSAKSLEIGAHKEKNVKATRIKISVKKHALGVRDRLRAAFNRQGGARRRKPAKTVRKPHIHQPCAQPCTCMEAEANAVMALTCEVVTSKYEDRLRDLRATSKKLRAAINSDLAEDELIYQSLRGKSAPPAAVNGEANPLGSHPEALRFRSREEVTM